MAMKLKDESAELESKRPIGLEIHCLLCGERNTTYVLIGDLDTLRCEGCSGEISVIGFRERLKELNKLSKWLGMIREIASDLNGEQ